MTRNIKKIYFFWALIALVAVFWGVGGILTPIEAIEGDYIDEWATSPQCIDAKGIVVFGSTVELTQPWNHKAFTFTTGGDYVGEWYPASSRQNDFATDGTYIYAVDGDTDKVYRYSTDDHNYIDSWALDAQNADAWGIATDGVSIWVNDQVDHLVYRYELDGTLLDSFDISGEFNGAEAGMTANSTYIYITNQTNFIAKYKTDGTYLGSIDPSLVSGASDVMGLSLNDDSSRLYLADYIDDKVYILEAGGELPPSASVWGVDPESETDITDLDTIITIGYEGLADYESLYITFRHPTTGLFTDAKKYEVDEIGESGELEINLQDFNIEKNGNWYLHAVAVKEGYQIEQGMFLSGYGWVWSDDLTDGEYYLDINIEGFDDIFAMSDFNSWYDENSKFDEPTAMFSAIAGFFQPIYSTVGEFGSRIENYFDKNTAYSKGYEIGKAIPVFSYYLEQVAVFMGGFPLMNWLLIIILILVGIFIFRVILKFIPGLGGS